MSILYHTEHEIEIDAISDISPVAAPTGERNTCKSWCQRCQLMLLPGDGHKWQWKTHVWGNRAFCYCQSCNVYSLAYQKLVPAIVATMARIERVLYARDGGPMWRHSRGVIDSAVGRAGLGGLKLAEKVEARLAEMEDVGYAAVCNILEILESEED